MFECYGRNQLTSQFLLFGDLSTTSATDSDFGFYLASIIASWNDQKGQLQAFDSAIDEKSLGDNKALFSLCI